MEYDEAWKRRRKREEDKDEEGSTQVEPWDRTHSDKNQLINDHKESIALPKAEIDSEKIDLYLKEADTLLNQLNNLYRLYELSIEKMPPIEKNRQLVLMMQRLAKAQKPTNAVHFRYQTLVGRFTSYKEKWEQILKKKETG